MRTCTCEEGFVGTATLLGTTTFDGCTGNLSDCSLVQLPRYQ